MVEVGTGEQGFAALSPGDSVEMTHGPQGGWHMMGALRTTGFDAIIEIHYTISVDAPDDPDRDGLLVCDQAYRVQSLDDPNNPDVHSFYGLYGYLEIDPLIDGELDSPPELLSYQSVIMTMEVTDSLGHAASGQVQVIATPDPEDLKLVP